MKNNVTSFWRRVLNAILTRRPQEYLKFYLFLLLIHLATLSVAMIYVIKVFIREGQ
jgi:hypothetical protein